MDPGAPTTRAGTATHAGLRRLLTAGGFLVAVGLLAATLAAAEPFDPDGYGPGQDARAYWTAPADAPYTPGSVGHESAYLYSPAFLQVVSPLRALPWTAFLGLWTIVLLAVLLWLGGPVLFGPLILLTFPELWGGNITILLAAAIVVGFRWPGAWAFALLTKVTPGLGLLWFVARREWRALGWALATTLVIVGISALVAPNQWLDWFRLLASSTGASTVPGSVPIPLVVRLPIAALVIVVGAIWNRRWLLPVGAFLAMPVIWWGSLAMLVGCVALRRREAEALVLDSLARLRPTASGREPAVDPQGRTS